MLESREWQITKCEDWIGSRPDLRTHYAPTLPGEDANWTDVG